MNNISSVSHSGAPAPIESSRAAGTAETGLSPARIRANDRVELSRAAQLLSRLSELPDVREDLVARVRAEIAAGGYETDAKIEQALDQLTEDLV